MKDLVIVCGVPGSGKSTWIKQQVQSNAKATYISRDEIRFSLISDEENYFSKENIVFNLYCAKIASALRGSKYNIVYADATHITESSRKKLLSRLNLGSDVLIHIVDFSHISTETCVNRNNLREGRSKVPKEVIYRMAKEYTDPSKDSFCKYSTICYIEEEKK